MSGIKYYEESDSLFNVIVNSEYATYNFLINAQDVPVIQEGCDFIFLLHYGKLN